MAYPYNTHPFYSSSTPSFYSTNTTHTPPFPAYPHYNPSSFSTTTLITSPTPNLDFNHGYSPPPHSRTQKMAFPICMDVPIFYGAFDDAKEWVVSMEKYLTVHDIPEATKVTAAVMALRDHALKWWLWHSQNHPPANWESFKVAFLWHFKLKFRDDLPLDEEEESHPELTILEDEEESRKQPNEKEEPDAEGVEEEQEEQRDEEEELKEEQDEPDSYPLSMVKLPSAHPFKNKSFRASTNPAPTPPPPTKSAPPLALEPPDLLIDQSPSLMPTAPPKPPDPPDPPDRGSVSRSPSPSPEPRLTIGPPSRFCFISLKKNTPPRKEVRLRAPQTHHQGRQNLCHLDLHAEPLDLQCISEMQSQLLASSTIHALPCDSLSACHVLSFLGYPSQPHDLLPSPNFREPLFQQIFHCPKKFQPFTASHVSSFERPTCPEIQQPALCPIEERPFTANQQPHSFFRGTSIHSSHLSFPSTSHIIPRAYAHLPTINYPSINYPPSVPLTPSHVPTSLYHPPQSHTLRASCPLLSHIRTPLLCKHLKGWMLLHSILSVPPCSIQLINFAKQKAQHVSTILSYTSFSCC